MEYTEFTCDWHPTLNHVTGEPLATPVLGAHTLTYVVLKQGSVLTTNFVQNETEVLRVLGTIGWQPAVTTDNRYMLKRPAGSRGDFRFMVGDDPGNMPGTASIYGRSEFGK